MKYIAIGAHLLRDDVEPLAEAIPVGELFLSALALADEQPVGDREILLRVAGIRAKLLDVATFLAIRYGFSFTSAEEAQAKCLAHLVRWKRALTAHRDHVEMSLKVAASAPTSAGRAAAASPGLERHRGAVGCVPGPIDAGRQRGGMDRADSFRREAL